MKVRIETFLCTTTYNMTLRLSAAKDPARVTREPAPLTHTWDEGLDPAILDILISIKRYKPS